MSNFVFLNTILNLNSYSESNSLLKVFGELFFLIIILIFIIILIIILSKILTNGKLKFNRKSNIEIIESKSIGFHNSLLLVSSGDKILLLSQTKDRITFISEIENIEIEEYKLSNYDFNSLLNKFMKKKSNDNNINETQNNN